MLTTIDLRNALTMMANGAAFDQGALFQAIKLESATASDRAMLKRFLYCRANEADKVALQEFINNLKEANK